MTKPATRGDAARVLARIRTELARAGELIDALTADAERAAVGAELGPHGRADEIRGRADELDRLREARELIDAADDHVHEAGQLLD
jgi:hypothetical protein